MARLFPAIGFGTSPMTGGLSAETVAAALAAGYRHIDTARKYGTERRRRRGDAGLAAAARRHLPHHQGVAREPAADDFARSVDDSLAALGVDYVDLLLVHWPNPEIPLAETMPALAKAKRDGLARHIGVANFNIALLDQAIALCPEPLVALQAEYHPYLDQTKLLAAVRERGLVFIAYCPLARGRLFADPVLADIAKAHGRSVAQVALRWLLQQEVAVDPLLVEPAAHRRQFRRVRLRPRRGRDARASRRSSARTAASPTPWAACPAAGTDRRADLPHEADAAFRLR